MNVEFSSQAVKKYCAWPHWTLSTIICWLPFDNCVNVKRCSPNTCPVLESVVYTLLPKWSRMTAASRPSMNSSASAKANSLCRTFFAWRRSSWRSSVWSLKQSHHWPFCTCYTRPSTPGLLKGKIFSIHHWLLFPRSGQKDGPLDISAWALHWWIKWWFLSIF